MPIELRESNPNCSRLSVASLQWMELEIRCVNHSLPEVWEADAVLLGKHVAIGERDLETKAGKKSANLLCIVLSMVCAAGKFDPVVF